MLVQYLNRIISVQRGQLLPHYQTIITLGFSNFAIDSFINEIYFAADTDDSLYSLFTEFPPFLINPWTYTQIHISTVVQGGGGVDGTPLEILICSSISKRFYLQWKAFDLLYKMRYILWVVALLGTCDVTNNGRHLGKHLFPSWPPCWILPRIRNQVKSSRNGDFLCLT